MQDILCPTDLTGASLVAAHVAADLAGRMNASVTLLHVLDRKHAGDREAAREALDMVAARTAGGAVIHPLLRDGDFLKEIAMESGAGHALLVCGTHGAKGVRQSLFGADILKLVRLAIVPSIVVQEHSPTALGEGPIVMPAAGHQDISPLLEAVVRLATVLGTEVQVYQILRPGEEASEQLLNNKKKMMERLTEAGIASHEVHEPLTGFSVGFAAQTADHARKTGASCIAIMAHASDEYRYIADAEKERLLVNEHGVPVLCAG